MSEQPWFKGKNWAITGALKGMTRGEATAKLEALGANVTGTVSAKTHFLVSGGYNPDNDKYLSNKELKARQNGTTILNDTQLQALFNGKTLEEVLPTGPKRAVVEQVAVRDALVEFRGLLYNEPDKKLWETICNLVDQCPPDDLPIVVDYINGNVEHWTEPYDITHHTWYNIPPTFRLMPDRWKLEVFQGKNSEKLRIIRVCNLHDGRMTGKVGLQMLACTHLSNVRYLDLGRNKLSTAFFKALRQAEQFRKVTHLNLNDQDFSQASAAAFAGPSVLGGITDLSINSCRFEGDALRTFFQAECWANLRVLLAHSLGRYSTPCDLFAALLDAPHIDKLEILDANYNHNLPAASLAAFIKGAPLGHLRVLRCSSTPLDGVGVEALASAPWLGQLEVLDLANNSITPDTSLAPLLASPHLGKLKELVVSGVSGDLAVLSRNADLAPTHLIYNGQVDERDLDALLGAHLLARVEHLTLGHSSPPGVFRRILRSPDAAHLQTLSIHRATIGPDDVEALLQSTWLGKLQYLSGSSVDALTEQHAQQIEKASHLHSQLRQSLPNHIRTTLRYRASRT